MDRNFPGKWQHNVVIFHFLKIIWCSRFAGNFKNSIIYNLFLKLIKHKVSSIKNSKIEACGEKSFIFPARSRDCFNLRKTNLGQQWPLWHSLKQPRTEIGRFAPSNTLTPSQIKLTSKEAFAVAATTHEPQSSRTEQLLEAVRLSQKVIRVASLKRGKKLQLLLLASDLYLMKV